MSMLFWNSQGAASAPFRRVFRMIVQEHRPLVVSLFEPRVSGIQVDKVVAAFGFNRSFRIEAHGFSGGLWLLWRELVRLDILTVSNQFLHGRYKLEAFDRWIFFTFVYASPEVAKRKCLWGQLNPGMGHHWVLRGDFNVILSSNERRGCSKFGGGDSLIFVEFLFDAELMDLGFLGVPFTWNQGDLYDRLDRCLGNTK
ncbi:hypothetical protein HRI_004914100 [Hibiscus trionum]|uniref:Endonuclease/exonuclease/phosphatase domain-containing protein n=1 Tax=Hibiscus trionum TaxID=183268 RepID=A0A9W7JIY1_HIBTR|nr:hypothetical protein HRI_004914100 [Hibiscus trionum]